MKEYLKNNKKFISYCEDNGISYEGLMRMPKCYGPDVVYFQVINSEKGKLGLLDDQPAKVILTVKRKGDNLTFEPSPDIKDYVVAR